MYPAVLLLHSWVRWAVVLFALLAIVRAISGAIGRRPWGRADDRAGTLFLRTLDLQMLLGLLVYFFLSPITRAAMADFGGAMKISGMRYWAVEHVVGMLIGVILAHRGQTRVRAIADPVRKHRVAAVFFVLALLVILASIPWPGTPDARPLFRW
ncbi:MAG: hypothetical protein ACRD15_01505 [Vicinamibacterales bacterium]